MITLLAIALAADPLPELADLVPETPTYATAKRRMYGIVWLDHRETFYCGCEFTEDRLVDPTACGLVQTGARAHRVEAEHVVPASAFGRTRDCWTEAAAKGKTGREHCTKVDDVFAAFYADLHVLVPANGHINAARGDLPFGYVADEPRAFGTCDFEVDREHHTAEPREELRGDVARIRFYVEFQYGFTIEDEAERRLLLHWDREDPPDEWERTWHRRATEVQGNAFRFAD